jgi:SAM-dependent methyltransferase
VKLEFARELRCPACLSDRSLESDARESDDREVREGTLRCGVCATEFPVRRGVMELLYEPPGYVVAEAAGLERFAEQMRAEGWDREKVRQLPDIEHGYWYAQSRSMHQLMTTIPFKAGQSILDVGSNTCWAANRFARRGLKAIALDIATTELQGLYTAEYFIDEGEVFFERVLGSMAAIPLASNSLDYVYCCEVLHHNDPQGLRHTFQEIFRVLRPGGRLLMVNETLKTLSDPDGVHVEGVEQFEGYEHAHWALSYRWEAARAGFMTEVTEPHYRPFFGDPAPSPRGAKAPLLGPFVRRGARVLQSSAIARHTYLSWLNHVQGGVQMNMIATKPVRYVGTDEAAGPLRRLPRMLAAASRLRTDRREGRIAPKPPRTPEQVAAGMRRSGSAEGSAPEASEASDARTALNDAPVQATETAAEASSL